MAADKDQLQGPSSESREAGYETSTVSIKGLALFVVGLILVGAMIHAGIWFLLGGYLWNDARKDVSYSALTDPRLTRGFKPPAPPPPRLQPNPDEEQPHVPSADLQQMLHGEDRAFSQMGWVIDLRSHRQLSIPPRVLAAVIQDETRRQAEESAAGTAREERNTMSAGVNGHSETH